MTARQGLQGLVITNPVNVRYLTGFTGSSGIAFISDEQAAFVTDFRYLDQAGEEVQNFSIFISTRTLFDTLKEKKLIDSGAKIGFEADHLPYSLYSSLKNLFPQTKFVPTEKLVERLAIQKDETEIVHLKQAAQIATDALTKTLPHLKIGSRERDFSAELSCQVRLLGAERDAFEPIVASGWRSALPHGLASDKVIDDGDFVVIDFGAVYHGYSSDMTRTVAMGKASPNMKRIYQIVKDAQQKAIDSARAGISCHALDQIAREYIHQKGFGPYFGHSLGHGLGLDVHSLPRVGAGSETILQENTVITIEPGIYIPNVGGVRIEDDILIQKDGCEVLTHFPKELLEIE
ncbi:MAG: aminopeptidase P family protein [Calditrichaeota bacterium]|nr:aminopeptidase P family protein [Calditrichota bacterium]